MKETRRRRRDDQEGALEAKKLEGQQQERIERPVLKQEALARALLSFSRQASAQVLLNLLAVFRLDLT